MCPTARVLPHCKHHKPVHIASDHRFPSYEISDATSFVFPSCNCWGCLRKPSWSCPRSLGETTGGRPPANSWNQRWQHRTYASILIARLHKKQYNSIMYIYISIAQLLYIIYLFCWFASYISCCNIALLAPHSILAHARPPFLVLCCSQHRARQVIHRQLPKRGRRCVRRRT